VSTSSVYSRIKRRETTSPRATLAIILAVIIILATAYAVTETILALTGQQPLLADPDQMGTAVVGLASYTPSIVIAAGVLAVLLGLLLIVAAFRAGRRPRHVLDTDRVVTVVDDEVIASALARSAAFQAGIDPDNTRVEVSRRRATIRLTPTSGTAVDRDPVTQTAGQQLQGYGLTPTVKPKIVVERSKVGA